MWQIKTFSQEIVNICVAVFDWINIKRMCPWVWAIINTQTVNYFAPRIYDECIFSNNVLFTFHLRTDEHHIFDVCEISRKSYQFNLSKCKYVPLFHIRIWINQNKNKNLTIQSCSSNYMHNLSFHTPLPADGAAFNDFDWLIALYCEVIVK